MNEALHCDHVPDCSGCAHIGMPYARQLRMKLDACRALFAAHALPGFDTERITSITPSPQPHAYRNRVRLAVGTCGTTPDGRRALVALGLYRAGTHDVVDIPQCPVQAGRINDTVEVIREAIVASGVSRYDEPSHTGDLRYVSVRTGVKTGEVLVGLIATRIEFPGRDALAGRVAHRCPNAVGVVLNVNPNPGNVIFGPTSETLVGRVYLEESVCGVRVRLGLQSFFQINTDVAERAYSAIVEHLIEGVADPASCLTVLDLYCGVGTIGLIGARRAAQVVGVERDAEAIDHARHAARSNRLDNAHFVAGDVERALRDIAPAHARRDGAARLGVVVNPPRKGLTGATLQQVAAMAPDRIAYLSCAPQTLLRDLGALTAHGFAVRHVELFDMFPQTDQIETLAILDRS